MKRNNKFFKARQDMAISISERLFVKCEAMAFDKPQPKAETVEEFLKRGGKINRLPPERR